MAIDIGTLVINMAADIAGLQQSMNAARETVSRGSEQISRYADMAKTALGAIGVGLSAGAAVNYLSSITTAAIQAADRIGELSQMTGVSVESLSKYQIAAKTSGVELEELSKAFVKLGRGMDEASGGTGTAKEAFDRLGISVRDSKGELKSSEQVMLEVAEKFANMDDGATKAAIAVELFGKSGAALIPFLNQGKDGLEELSRTAKALGLVMDEELVRAADATADSMTIVGMMAQGLGTRIMAELLPVIYKVVQGLIDFAVETNAVQVAAELVAGAFRVMVNAGQIVGGTLAYLATWAGGVAEALMALATGQPSRALDVLKNTSMQAGAVIQATWEDVNRVWTQTTAVIPGKPDDLDKSQKFTAAQSASAAAAKKAADELERQRKATDDLITSIADKLSVMQQEEVAGGSLAESDKLQNTVLTSLRDGKIALTAEQWNHIQAMIAEMRQAEATNRSRKEEETALKEVYEARKKDGQEATKRAEEIEKQVAKQREENAAFGLTKAALAELEVARLDEAIAIAEAAVARDEEIGLCNEETDAHIRTLNALKELRGLKADRVHIEAAAEAAKKWEDTSKDIEKSLTDALMRGFESGKDFGRNLIDTVKNLFKSLVIRFAVEPFVKPVSQGIAGMFNPFASAATSASGGSGGGGLSSLLGMATSGMSTFGSYAATGLMNTIAGEGLFSGLSAAGSLLEGGSIMGGLGMGLGAIAPYALAAIAIMSLLGDGGGPKSGGEAIYSNSGGVLQNLTATTGQRLLYTPNDADSKMATTVETLMRGVTGAAALMGGVAGDLKIGLGYDMAPDGKASQRISSFVSRGNGDLIYGAINKDFGTDPKAFEKGIQDEIAILMLGALQGSTLPTQFQEFFAQFDLSEVTGETARAALDMATNAARMTAALVDAGGVFAQLSGTSVEARNAILQMTGGLDAFIAKAGSFIKNYYSSEEQNAISAAALVRSLGAAGFSAEQINSLVTREDFRTLIESLDLSTERGQAQFATLLNNSELFAQLSAYLTDNETTLGNLATLAPGGAALEALIGTSTNSASAATASQTQVTLLTSIDGTLATMSANSAESNRAIVAALDRVAAGLNGINANNFLQSTAPSEPVYDYGTG